MVTGFVNGYPEVTTRGGKRIVAFDEKRFAGVEVNRLRDGFQFGEFLAL